MNDKVLVNGKAVDYSTLPEGLQGGMQRYIEHGIKPGSFLEAVLNNDLRSACELADSFNRFKLFDIVSWLYNNAPTGSWGHQKAVHLWIHKDAPN